MRKLIIFILVLGVLGATAYGGRRVYRQWKAGRAVTQAREAFARSDFKEGGLWLRKAISANGNNIEAVRMMGDFADVMHVPAAVFWRNRLVELEPALTNRLMLARAAITQREYATARKALDGVDLTDRQDPEFQKVNGALALATGELQQAEASFTEALKLQPNNLTLQLNLAVLQSRRNESEVARAGRQALEQLSTNQSVRVEALRHLARDARAQTNLARALHFAEQLIRETNSAYSDRLLHLELLRDSKSPALQSAVAGCERAAGTNTGQIFALSRWRFASFGAQETMQWLKTLSPNITTNLPVTMVVADAYLGTADWPGLQKYVDGQNWGDVDHLRHTFASRALREQGLGTASKAEWSKALKLAEGRQDRLEALERVTATWKWIPELEEVLWAIVNKFPKEKSAVQSLSNILIAGGKTRSLLTLYAQETKRDSDNLAVKNNLASIALLLQAEELRPHQLAQEVYEKQKTNANYVSTYAYSLHIQKKSAEAVRLMRELPSTELEQPSIAGYYGIMLAAVGEEEKAKHYLKLAANAPVLPEEKELFRRVRF